MHSLSPSISVIIPTLNEADTLRSALRAARSDDCSIEWIVVDGGSKDKTRAIAEDEGCLVIRSDRAERARQLNFGASAARSQVLLFSMQTPASPKYGIRRILEALENPVIVGGGFVRSFDSPSVFLQLTCRLAAWRSRRWGFFLGDQGIFVRRDIFDKLGGFEESRKIAEDLDFSLRLKEQGKVVALPGPAISSARRFANRGPLIQSLIDLWLTVKFFAGR